MRVIIDLERDIIIIPDNFFAQIAKENGKLEKYGAKPVSGLDRIRHSFEAAMADTDTRLLTQMNAKKSNATQVAIVTAETAEKVETKEGDVK